MSTFPTIFEWLERFDFLRGMPAAYLTLAVGVALTIIWDWRVTVFALLVQYLAASLLYSDVLDPRLAFVKLLVGLFVCLILYFTARQSGWGEAPSDLDAAERARWRSHSMPRRSRFPFRVVLALAVVVLLLAASDRPAFQLPAVPPALNFAIYALVALGLVNLAVTSEPLRSGAALLMILSGFELFYNSLEQSVFMLFLLATVNLGVALATAYLTQISHVLPSGDALR